MKGRGVKGRGVEGSGVERNGECWWDKIARNVWMEVDELVCCIWYVSLL